MEDASLSPKKPLIPAKYGPWLLSLLGGSSLIVFWSYLDQSQRPWTAGKLPPALTGNVGAVPSTNVPTSGQPTGLVQRLFEGDDRGERENGEDDGEEYAGVTNQAPAVAPTVPATQPTGSQPTPPSATPSSKYKDGTYTASANAPWGAMTIVVTARNGKWVDIQTTSIPDSPPSYYAAPQLVQQALAAQSASIDGVSGATYTSNAFRDDLTQIVRQSAN